MSLPFCVGGANIVQGHRDGYLSVQSQTWSKCVVQEALPCGVADKATWVAEIPPDFVLL